MKKIYLIIAGVVGLFSIGGIQAQQDPYFTHFAYNRVLFNPAVAGANGQFCLNMVNHQQWRGYDDLTGKYETRGGLPIGDQYVYKNVAPRNIGVGFAAPLTFIKPGVNYGGITIGFLNDVTGFESTTEFKIGANFNLLYKQTDKSLRVGFSYSNINKKLDGAKLRPMDPDPRVPNNTVGDGQGELGLGIYYTNENMNNLYVGASVTHFTPKAYNYTPNIQVETKRHLYLMAGMRIENFLNNPALWFDPAVQIKSVMSEGFSPFQFDLQGMVTWNQTFAGGLAFRNGNKLFNGDAVSLMLGYYPPIRGQFKTQTLRIGYSYDITTSRVQRVSNGTHEFQVNYCFTLAVKTKRIPPFQHPRWQMRDKDFE